jgi:ABC-type sugar transport system ATPase subunit
LGLGLVPEDRQHEGLLLPMTVRENVSLAVLRQLTRFGLVQRRLETALVQRLLDRLQVKAASEESAAETLSGGNQQKLVLGKWLALNPRVLILDEPTRGIDVGAKAQVHQMIRQLAADGMATLLISSELPELLSICDRILVMRGGRLSGELAGDVATQAALLQLALPDEQTTVSTV